MKPKSTNPFDSDSSADEPEENFYDCLEKDEQKKEAASPRVRSAVLNFDKPFDDVEQPALKFDQIPSAGSSDFFSPLENAMMQFGSSPMERNTSATDDDTDAESPIVNSHATGYSSLSASPGSTKRGSKIPSEISTEGLNARDGKRRSNSKRKLVVNSKPNAIMTELLSGENEFHIDYKSILLEDLGTASSWLILLLPYFAFIITLLLESSKTLQVSSIGPLSAAIPCDEDMVVKALGPCHFSSRAIFEQDDFDTSDKLHVSYDGTAFESGNIHNIPVLSTYLYGDAIFENLSTHAVAIVAQGMLESSVKVMQRNSVHLEGENEWTLMFSSNPRKVSMTCRKEGTFSSKTSWNCKTPRILDVVFSMPETAVYGGGDVRIVISYSFKQVVLDQKDASHVYTKTKDTAELFSAIQTEHTSSLVEEIVTSSSYTFEHMSPIEMKLDTGVRLFTFVITFVFIVYWCYSINTKGRKQGALWWESPWVLFPERYYIVGLIFALLLVQEPVLVAMFFFPMLGSSPKLRIAVDATAGIGVHTVLFVYVSLFHGFQYHTAAISKKRTAHQRQNLQLRRAAKYLARNQSPTERWVDDYYDQYGDIDGSASTIYLRLGNDPFADGWADFLLTKLFLLFLGVASVIGTAYCRFPPRHDNVAELDDEILDEYKFAYIISTALQFIILITWVFLILAAAMETGRKLRTEPFLGTRPVQLAYRILFAHMSLSFLALLVSFCLNLSRLLRKWSLADQTSADSLSPLMTTRDEDLSRLEMIMMVLSQVARQFPYSGTAASVGSGRILFATISILITAFIFLPAHALEDEDEDLSDRTNLGRKGALQDKLQEQRRLRRDKRSVVNLAKQSKTWRVFPIPIEQSSVATTMLQDNLFQLYKDGHVDDDNIRDRGIVSRGPYTPLFCLELSCWLNECSWQAYYSPAGIQSKRAATGGMNLEALGLRLEGAVLDDVTDTQAYIATNIAPQVDGDEDSIIVIAFRGTASASNLQTDLRSRQVPLLDQVASIGTAPFCIFPDRVDIYDDDGWIWDTPAFRAASGERIQCASSWSSPKPGCIRSHCARENDTTLEVVSKGARAILQATPVARSSFPLVHEGFQEVYTHIRRQIFDILFPVLQRQLAKSLEAQETGVRKEREPLALPKIYVTGHSLGGSLAQLLALDLASNCELVIPTEITNTNDQDVSTRPEGELFNLPITHTSYQHGSAQSTTSNEHHDNQMKELRLQPPIAVYTFGQPRVGNKAFSRLFKQRVPHCFRVVNEGDAITTMPNFVFCGGIYKHAGLEVLLDEGMTGNILVGPTVVETLFRFHKMRSNMFAHTMERYRNCLECAFEEHELLEYYQGHNVVAKDIRGKEHYTTHAEIPDWMTQARNPKK